MADSVLLFGKLSLKYLMVLNKAVSSAYIIKLNILLAFGKSLIYIINNKGTTDGSLWYTNCNR